MLKTTQETFPWWSGDLVLSAPFDKNFELEYKFMLLRDHHVEMWEKFEGNRKRTIGTSECSVAIYNKFGDKLWNCPICGTTVDDEKPVLCPKLQHPIHMECFSLYLGDLLEKKCVDVACMRCSAPIHDEAWQFGIAPSIAKRYNRVVAEIMGAKILRCPMGQCEFEVVYNQDGGNFDIIPETAVCGDCGANWCTTCDRLVEEYCKICANGLKEVADKIFEALEDAAGIKCPTCKQRGQKLPSECTHITCDCGTVYCYCCGLSGADVDTSDEYASTDIDRLYGHNDDYSTDEKRCPMWLINFGDKMSNWPSDVEKAQKKFHKMKACDRLKKAKDEISQWEWESFMDLDETVKTLVEKYVSKSFS
jgi:hypothetical protein